MGGRRSAVNRPIDPTWLISISVVVISLYMNPGLADPFNSPKLWALMIFGTWIFGYVLVTLKFQRFFSSKEIRIPVFLILLFVFSMFLSAFSTENMYTAFFGEQQRRLGFIFYFFMAIFMVASALFFTINSIYKLYNSALFLSILLVVYGLMQHTGNDFISWENPYNSIILTLGNPNFASALMSILALFIFSYSFAVKAAYKLVLLGWVVIILVLINLSNSLQGLIVFGIGSSLVILVYLHTKSKKLAILFLSVFAAIFSLMVLAMLQIGPLTEYIYKTSVSARGYYWRSGIEMLKLNPLTGVGLDSYGENFRLVREKGYPLTYGFQLSTDNAHNVPIQIFATGGIFTGFTYLMLTLFILNRGIVAWRLVNPDKKFLVLGMIAAWIGFQTQSIISIDNVGLTIWGWVLGGTIIGLSKKPDNNNQKRTDSKESFYNNEVVLLQQKIVSSVLALITFICCSVLYQGEKLMYEILSYAGTNPPSTEFITSMEKFERQHLVEPAYRFRAAGIWYQIGDVEKSKVEIEKLLNQNSDSFDYLNAAAQIYTSKSDWKKVIEVRQKIASIDPWNAINLLLLAQANENNSNLRSAIESYNKVLEFASDVPEGKQAKLELERLSK
jgi:O-antigen ligase